MCGLVGYISLTNPNPLSVETFMRMNDALSHRGPDGEGFYFTKPIEESQLSAIKTKRPEGHVLFEENSPRSLALGHRRLSIIDLSSNAAQPMQSYDGRITLVFNGEIYNHRAIREKLQDKYPFKTDHSDTETIIYAYLEWGIDFLHHLRGMFSIALWDRDKDELFLVRDRIGIKPLYYTIHKGRLYFASEIKSLLQEKTLPRKINERAVYDYLSFVTVPAPNTMFDGIYKLEAGTYISVKKGNISPPQEYWDLFDNVQNLKSLSEEEIISGLRSKLEDAVESHLESDVPIGVFLSGGIDSSANAALFSKVAPGKVKAFSIGYADDNKLTSYKNEFEYSRLVAKKLGCEYYEQELTQKDLLDFLPNLVKSQDEPIADPVCVPVYYVSKLARENGVTVAQVGEGSDELFCGYASWMKFLKAQALSNLPIPKPLKSLGLLGLKGIGKGQSYHYELLRRSRHGEPLFWNGAECFYEANKKHMLSDRLRKQFESTSSWETLAPYYESFKKSGAEQTALNWMTYIDLKVRLPELLLMRVDKMSMAVSLECRVPFLDHEFVEYALSIPSQLKTKNNEPKYVLKKAVEGLIPNEIIYRKKQGFGAPVHDWLLSDLGEVTRTEIKEFNKKWAFFDEERLENLTQYKDARIWPILNLALWCKEYIS